MNAFLGEIRPFAGNFVPTGWALCNGQLLDVSTNIPLFALLGTNFGGDGQRKFAVPDLRGCAPVGQGTGPGLSSYTVGDSGGEATHRLVTEELPPHVHSFNADDDAADAVSPASTMFGAGASRTVLLYGQDSGRAAFHPLAVGETGGNQGHENRQPFLAFNYIIALQGIYPQRQ